MLGEKGRVKWGGGLGGEGGEGGFKIRGGGAPGRWERGALWPGLRGVRQRRSSRARASRSHMQWQAGGLPLSHARLPSFALTPLCAAARHLLLRSRLTFTLFVSPLPLAPTAGFLPFLLFPVPILSPCLLLSNLPCLLSLIIRIIPLLLFSHPCVYPCRQERTPAFVLKPGIPSTVLMVGCPFWVQELGLALNWT